MQDLSLHVLDIAENCIEAGATRIEISINENKKRNVLTIQIKDNGEGIDDARLKRVLDPFYTTKELKRVGLGLSMLAQATREAEGAFDIKSKKGVGTTVTATFQYDHIDRKPLGNMAETIIALIAAAGLDIDVIYKHRKNSNSFILDTKHIKRELQGVSVNDPEILDSLKRKISNKLKELEERSQYAKT